MPECWHSDPQEWPDYFYKGMILHCRFCSAWKFDRPGYRVQIIENQYLPGHIFPAIVQVEGAPADWHLAEVIT